ncbi:MAG: hypothetical protein HOP10_16780 [Chitinophagaceae bacterium]|nr:hypothetical protein [Chitinophagaceae bacterium]
MSTPDLQVYKGKISFINHQKQFATIEYLYNNKEKAVNFKTDSGIGKKSHQFRLGDGVSFQLRLSDRGDKMAAYNVKFTHNTSVDLLIQKAAIENRFSGYLKMVENKYFVKEWESYILFPLLLSPWEVPPVETAANEAISFTLINLDKPNSIQAELFSHNYIPEYRKAVQHFNNKIDIEATVSKIAPHGVYLDLFGEKMKAKLGIEEAGEVKKGDTVQVLITYLSPYRVVVKKVADTGL